MPAIATWCYRHRRLILLFWAVALVGMTVASRAEGTAYSNSFTLPNTESTRAITLLESVSPNVSGDTERIVFQATGGAQVSDPEIRNRVESMLHEVSRLHSVSTIVSPYDPTGVHQISKNGDIAFATVTFDEQFQNISNAEAVKLVATAQSAADANLRVAVAGQLAEQANRPSFGGTGLGVLLAGIVLLLVFGSLFAMALPLISAMASLGTAIGLIGLLSNVMKMPQFSAELVLLIGLGVGVDYALFIVTRHRQGLIAGRDPESSVVNAINTSGRAVFFAGIIVCIALLGMFALGVTFLYGLAVAAAIGVAFTMIAALTILPAMLGKPNGHLKLIHALSLHRDHELASVLSLTMGYVRSKQPAELTAIIEGWPATGDKTASHSHRILKDAEIAMRPLSEVDTVATSVYHELALSA